MTHEPFAVEIVDGPDLAVVTLSGPLTTHTLPAVNGGLG